MQWNLTTYSSILPKSARLSRRNVAKCTNFRQKFLGEEFVNWSIWFDHGTAKLVRDFNCCHSSKKCRLNCLASYGTETKTGFKQYSIASN